MSAYMSHKINNSFRSVFTANVPLVSTIFQTDKRELMIFFTTRSHILSHPMFLHNFHFPSSAGVEREKELLINLIFTPHLFLILSPVIFRRSYTSSPTFHFRAASLGFCLHGARRIFFFFRHLLRRRSGDDRWRHL